MLREHNQYNTDKDRSYAVKEIIKAKKTTLRNYAKRRILKEKTILKPTLTTIYKIQAKSIEEPCQGIVIFKGQLRKLANI